MNIEPMIAHGWKFEFNDSQLVISSEDSPQEQQQLSAQAAYSLLDYLYQYRDDLHDAAEREKNVRVERQKEEFRAARENEVSNE